MVRSRLAARTVEPTAFRYEGEALHKKWTRLHAGDQEPFPDARHIARLAKPGAKLQAWLEKHGGAERVAQGVQDAWREFHAGDFTRAIEIGSDWGVFGAAAACKAAAIHANELPREASAALRILQTAARRGEEPLELLPDSPNAHYMLALVLGRYSQRISILKALAEGIGGRVRTLLERALELESAHADAHIAFGLYHAEIVGKLGSLVAGLTYQASERAALQHFRKALELNPGAPIAHIEFAQGLLLLDERKHRQEAAKAYERAAACKPADAMEQIDVERARRGLG